MQTYDGGYLLSLFNGNPTNCIVYKLDVNGNILWQKTVANPSDYCFVESICPTYEGGFIIGGVCTKYDPMGAAFMMTFNECAEKEWLKEYGIYNDYEFVTAIRQTTDSNYIAGACYFGNNATERVGLIKIDGNGDTLWYRDYTHSVNADLVNLRVLTDGNYYIVGRVFIPNSRDQAIKINSIGNELWYQTYGTNNLSNDAYDGIQTPDSGYINLSYRGTSARRHWSFITKTSSGGFTQWNKFLSDTNDLSERPVNILKLTDSTALVLCNVSYSYTSATHDDYRLKAIKIDMQGNVLDSVQFGMGDNYAKEAIVNKDGDVVVCGWHDTGSQNGAFAIKIRQDLQIDTMFNVVLNYDSLCSSTISNGFIPYDTTTVGITEIDMNQNSTTITALPNPFSDKTEIKIVLQEQVNDAVLIVKNCVGQEVKTFKITSKVESVYISSTDIAKGFYTCSVQDGKKILGTLKLIRLN